MKRESYLSHDSDLRIGGLALMAWLLICALAQSTALGAEAPVTSLADGRDGTIAFASTTPSGPDQYLGAAGEAPAVVVSGLLRLPAGTARVPAVVLTHSAGGVSQDRDLAWAQRFVDAGMAAFVVDSFGPRGVKGFRNQPSLFASVADVYAALHLLATHPRIDASRVALMGFSRGGIVALVSALEPVRRMGAPDGARFAAHIALYPVCNTRYLAGEITRAPILMLLGAADDQAPPAPCRRYAEWFRAKGAPTTVVEYPGAHHLFDGTGPEQFIAEAVGPASCDLEYHTDTRHTDTGAVLAGADVGAYLATCSVRGVHVGGNAQARADAEQQVAAFLKAALGN